MSNILSKGEDLAKLEKLYTGGEFDKAIDVLLSNKTKLDTGVFHFNLGTMYAKKGEFAIGRFHLEKSLHEGLSSKELYYNLNGVKHNLAQTGVSADNGFVDDAILDFASFPLDIYLLATLFLTAITLTIYRFTNLIIKKRVVAILLVLSLSPLLMQKVYFNERKLAITLKEIPVREGPSEIYSQSRLLPAGEKILLGSFYEGWYRILVPMNISGWIKKDDIGVF